MTGQGKDISVVVPTLDRPDDLARFLESLTAQTRLPDELIVVDASAGDATRQVLDKAREKAGFDIVAFRTPPGTASQRNKGAKAARGRVVFFFDDDVVLEPDCLEQAVAAFDAHARDSRGRPLGAVVCRITNAPDRPRGLTGLFQRVFLLTSVGDGRIKPSGFPAPAVTGPSREVRFAPAGCTGFARAVFGTRLYDENLPGYAYMEDLDLSRRMSAEYRILFEPSARLAHYSSTHTAADARALRRMMIRHHLYINRKHRPHTWLEKAAIAWSVVGLFVVNGLLLHDLRAVLGLVEGLFSPLGPTRHDPEFFA